jgi:predicted DNA-binding protein (MmcQ/YjbR family)
VSAKRIARLRAICLGLPETMEKETWGHPTFRVRDKMFAACGDDAATFTFKADPDERVPLLGDDRFFVPAYVGSKGWLGMRLDGEVDWVEVAELVETSWTLIAPKRVSAAHRAAGSSPS